MLLDFTDRIAGGHDSTIMMNLRLDALSLLLCVAVVGCDADDGSDTVADASTSEGESDDTEGGEGDSAMETMSPDGTSTSETGGQGDETDGQGDETTEGAACDPAPEVDDVCTALENHLLDCEWDPQDADDLRIECADNVDHTLDLEAYYACLWAVDCAALPTGAADPDDPCACHGWD